MTAKSKLNSLWTNLITPPLRAKSSGTVISYCLEDNVSSIVLSLPIEYIPTTSKSSLVGLALPLLKYLKPFFNLASILIKTGSVGISSVGLEDEEGLFALILST